MAWRDNAGGGASSLVELGDTDIVNPADNQGILYNGTTSKWENKAIAGAGATTLAGLNDTDIAALVVNGQTLVWNGTHWANEKLGGLVLPWLTATDYKIDDVIFEKTGNQIYRCLTAHTSGIFANDLANWQSLGGGSLPVLNSAQIFVGDGANTAQAVAMSGEATIANTGALTLNNAAVLAKLLTGFASGAGTVLATDTILQSLQKIVGNFGDISINDLTNVTLATPTDGQILVYQSGEFVNEDVTPALPSLNDGQIFVGDVTNEAAAVTPSGEATFSNAGVISLSNASIIAKVLTGFSGSPGVVVGTDSILEAMQKVVGNVSALTLDNLANIDITAVTDNQILMYIAASGKWENRDPTSGVTTFSGLTDTEFTALSDNQIPRYDTASGKWVNEDLPVDSMPGISDLLDTTITNAAADEILTYDGINTVWINKAAPASVTTLEELTDTVITAPVDGEILTYDFALTKWVNVISPSGVTTLSALTDTEITTPASGETLEYNGADWTNVARHKGYLLNPSALKNSSFTGDANTVYPVTCAVVGVTAVLPSTPNDGDIQRFFDAENSFGDNDFTITKSDKDIIQSGGEGATTSSITVSESGSALELIFNTSSDAWYVNHNFTPTTSIQTKIDLKEDAANKDIANGYASLDGNIKIPLALIPDSLVNAISYEGAWDASGGTYPLTPSSGDAYIISVAGTISGELHNIGDLIIFNGTVWNRFDASQIGVTSVAGRIGDVVLTSADLTDNLTIARIDSTNVFAALQKFYINLDDTNFASFGKDDANIKAVIRNEANYGRFDLYDNIGSNIVSLKSNGASIIPDIENATINVTDKATVKDLEVTGLITGIPSCDPAIYGIHSADNEADLSNWGTGNDATFLTAGIFGGVFEKEIVSPLSGSESYKYTQGAGSQDDWIASPTIAVKKRSVAKNNLLKMAYTNTAPSGSIDLVIYDVNNSRIIPIESDLPSKIDSANREVLFFMPSNTTQIRFGFHVKNLSNGSTLIFDDQIFNDDGLPETQFEINGNYRITQIGTALSNRAGETQFSLGIASIVKSGKIDSIIQAEDDPANTRTKWIALQECIVIVDATLISGSAFERKIGINGTPITSGSQQAGEGQVVTSFSLLKDDFITVGLNINDDALKFDSSASILNNAASNIVSISAKAVSSALATSASGIQNDFSARIINSGVPSIGSVKGFNGFSNPNLDATGKVTIDISGFGFTNIPLPSATPIINNDAQFTAQIINVTTTSVTVLTVFDNGTNANCDFTLGLSAADDDWINPTAYALYQNNVKSDVERKVGYWYGQPEYERSINVAGTFSTGQTITNIGTGITPTGSFAYAGADYPLSSSEAGTINYIKATGDIKYFGVGNAQDVRLPIRYTKDSENI